MKESDIDTKKIEHALRSALLQDYKNQDWSEIGKICVEFSYMPHREIWRLAAFVDVKYKDDSTRNLFYQQVWVVSQESISSRSDWIPQVKEEELLDPKSSVRTEWFRNATKELVKHINEKYNKDHPPEEIK